MRGPLFTAGSGKNTIHFGNEINISTCKLIKGSIPKWV